MANPAHDGILGLERSVLDRDSVHDVGAKAADVDGEGADPGGEGRRVAMRSGRRGGGPGSVPLAARCLREADGTGPMQGPEGEVDD